MTDITTIKENMPVATLATAVIVRRGAKRPDLLERRYRRAIQGARRIDRRRPLTVDRESSFGLLRRFTIHGSRFTIHVFCFLSVGKSMTSLIEGESVRSITSLSIPIPSPAAGGMPYSSAVT